MINHTTARDIAEAHLRAHPLPPQDGQCLILLETATIERPFGWVFFSGRPDGAVAGKAPLLVLRESGHTIPLSTAHAVQWHLENFERTGNPFAPGITEWDVVRQDDNGHRTIVKSFTAEPEARAMVARFESLHHKQTYWVESRVRTP